MVALLDDIEKEKIQKNEVILFWNTYCADPFETSTAAVDYTQLPATFHSYFQ